MHTSMTKNVSRLLLCSFLLGMNIIFSADQRQDLANQLLSAVDYSMPDDVERLLKAGAYINAHPQVAHDYGTVLYFAMYGSGIAREQNILLLLERGAFVEDNDFPFAAYGESRKIARALCERGMYVDLYWVVSGSGRIDTARDLLGLEADPIWSRHCSTGETALDCAQHRKLDELVELFEDYVKRGARALEDFDNQYPHLRYTPQRLTYQEQAKRNKELFEGVRNCTLTVEQVKSLVEQGADIECCENVDICETPLIAALKYRGERQGDAEKIALILIELGSLVNRTYSGMTPLHYAVIAGFDRVVAALIAKKANVDALNDAPLHVAAKTGNTPIALMLVAAGADKSLRTRAEWRSGTKTAALLAQENGHHDLARLLAEGIEDAFVEKDVRQ